MNRRILSLSVLLALACLAAWAQAVSGTLSGRVTAVSGAGVPNAAVTVTNSDTKVSQRVLTGPDGAFSIAGLPPGTYQVDVETAGFKRSSQQNLELTATAPATVNITLEAGNMNETVEIKATSPAVEGETGEVHQGYDTRVVRELPIIDRNFQDLVGLQSGVNPPQALYPPLVDPSQNRFFSTNGQSPVINMWQMDGVTNLEPFRGTAVRVQPLESIQQMNVVSGNWRADKGYTGGAWVTNITRGGTNDWHGSLFEFHSDNNLRSRSFFDANGFSKPRFTYNQFGATAGGRIIRDKLFFFGSYEGTYNRGDNLNLATVPTPAMTAGVFTGIPGVALYNPATGTEAGVGRFPFNNNVIPSGMINPAAAAIAARFPSPNLPGFVNNYLVNTPYQNDAQRFDGRLDDHWSDRTSAFLRYGYTNARDLQSSPYGAAIGGAPHNRLLGQNVVADVTHSFTPELITDFRFGYNRYLTRLASGNDPGALGTSAFGAGLPALSITGLDTLGTPANYPMTGLDNTFNFVWDWAWRSDRHNVKAGVDIRRLRSDGFINPNLAFGALGGAVFGPGATLSPAEGSLGAYSAFANSFAGFLLGAPSATGAAMFTESPTYRQSLYSLYLADNIRVTHRLSVDVGLRWEVYSPLEPRSAGGAMFYDPAYNTLNYAGLNGYGMHGWRYDLDNIAPRFGFAYRATEKTVIRGGYGWSYFQTPYAYSGFMPTMTATAAGVAGIFGVAPGTFGTAAIAAPAVTGAPVNGTPAPNIPLSVVPRDLQTPYAQSFNLQVQQEIFWGMVFDLGYVGTLGRDLPYVQELNAGAAGTGVAGLPFAGFGRTASTLFYGTGLTDNYNSLQVNLSKRFSHGLSFQGSYTFSKALGYTTGNNNMLLNPFDRAANYGPMDYDRQHVLTISHLWNLPFGAGTNHLNHGIVGQIAGNWQINGIFTWATGTPLTVTANPLFCNCPNSTLLANVSGPVGATYNAPFAGYGGAFFNTSDFSIPSANSFGTAGRGVVRGPGMRNYNLSLFRSFPIHDHYKLELRGEAYNLTNSTQYVNPVMDINSPMFGQSTGTLYGAFGRQFNIGARLLF